MLKALLFDVDGTLADTERDGHRPAFNAAFRRAGVIRADTSEEIFDWARALAWCPPPGGRAVAVLTNAGGPGVTAADALEASDMRLANLSPTTKEALKNLLPAAASLHNPVDMLASASPEQYAACLRLLLDDRAVDAAMVILPPPPMFTAGAVAKALIPIIHAAEKPVVVALMGERLIQEAVEHFRAARVPEYRFPERAASALAVLAQRAEYLARAAETPNALRGVDTTGAKAFLAGAADGWLAPQDANALLRAYGISIPTTCVAHSPQEAVEAALQAGFPVAMKIESPEIAHKTDVGGVLLNLEDEASVRRGYITLVENVQHGRPEAHILGVQVQQMIPTGQEVIVGAVRDAQFGPLVMFGSGGVEVEGLKDVAFALAPLTNEEASHLLESTWAGRKLSGFRNLPPADRQAVLNTLFRLAHLASDFPQIAEVEINPLRVLTQSQGVFALDVRVRVVNDQVKT